ncbi:MAG: 50S ribosomal protein L25 [Oscillochloris sp.]|nr:50S ribosomal protein L25 [Oscillochloris sp.]
MAHKFAIEAEVRTVLGKKVKNLRRAGLLPATVYGKGFDPVSVQINDRDFNLTYRQAGRTTVIDMKINGQVTQAVFVQAVQRHPVSRGILHVDFKVVDLFKPVQVEVPLTMVGEAPPIVARGDALVNMLYPTVLVEALPDNLPQNIEVDISKLTSPDKHLTVADLATSSLYKVLADDALVLVALTQTRMAATLAEEAEAEAEAAEGDGEGEGEAEGEDEDEDEEK